MDKYFGSVCELDIIFNFEKAYFVLDEYLLAGNLQESSTKKVVFQFFSKILNFFPDFEGDKRSGPNAGGGPGARSYTIHSGGVWSVISVFYYFANILVFTQKLGYFSIFQNFVEISQFQVLL